MKKQSDHALPAESNSTKATPAAVTLLAKAAQMRTDFLPKDAYLARDFLELEKERLWPRVWQVACREEELPAVGDYLTYDIADDSVILIRTAPDTIKAYHNVCQHRGRRLVSEDGHATKFHCRFHGWQWNIDGSLARVLDRDDWQGCPDFADSDLRLKDVRLDVWQGFVFINMNSDAEPLAKFLDPIPRIIDIYDIGKMRYRWYRSIKLPCNWKVATEAFNEGYHAFATHPQMMHCYGDDWTRSHAVGQHGMFAFPGERRPVGWPTSRLDKLPIPKDIRPGYLEWFRIMEEQLAGITSDRDYQAAHRMMSELTEETPLPEVFAKVMQFQKDAAIASGAGWPDISIEQMIEAGSDWHVFPNFIFLPYPDGTLAYRARPAGDDPDWCIFDIWSLVRYAPGAEPPLKRELYHSDTDWCEDVENKMGLIPSQDIANMHEVQRGMKSRGFKGSRTNPLQESTVSNFHRALYDFLK